MQDVAVFTEKNTQGTAQMYQKQTHTHPVHPQTRAPKHTQSRLPLMALGFTHMTHDIHVGNNNDAHTEIYTQNLPTLSLRVTCSKHHQPHMPHMLCCEQGNCFHTHKSKHTNTHTQREMLLPRCNLRKAAFIYQLRLILLHTLSS